MNEGRKDDIGKLRFDLIPVESLLEVVKVYTFGARKYQDRNWEKGIRYSRVFAAINRHLWAFWNGENADNETGFSHLAHAAWGCLALIHYAKHNTDKDDRPEYD